MFPPRHPLLADHFHRSGFPHHEQYNTTRGSSVLSQPLPSSPPCPPLLPLPPQPVSTNTGPVSTGPSQTTPRARDEQRGISSPAACSPQTTFCRTPSAQTTRTRVVPNSGEKGDHSAGDHTRSGAETPEAAFLALRDRPVVFEQLVEFPPYFGDPPYFNKYPKYQGAIPRRGIVGPPPSFALGWGHAALRQR